ncbi:hypothetical protein BJY04DRAFT_212604 [Aspergillus karnatakaensis]|uniref:DUF2985 domain-containing protein n=1 Tax=Aspergillus karnatakaensis TaxID=1810916 RepID=UPI003CCD8C20
MRSSSISTATRLLEYSPASGMWQATGTAIAHAPNITDLRSPDEVGFNVHGHSVRRVGIQNSLSGDRRERQIRAVGSMNGNTPATLESEDEKSIDGVDETPLTTTSPTLETTRQEVTQNVSAPWSTVCRNASVAAWKFICTPTGLFITIYGLNVIAWGAMLFFLLLNVGSMSKERKELWIEIDSQILNALFCLTSWGLAPWRIRDTYWLLVWRFGSGERSKESIRQLAKRNASWFRMRDGGHGDGEEASDQVPLRKTLTGRIAPATSSWKMDFVVVNMLLNSLFQVGMATFMWYYNKDNRPSFGVGLFIGLGCLSSLLAGVMSWWEGRKIKRIEGAGLQRDEENT